jgi:hypothetical protein
MIVFTLTERGGSISTDCEPKTTYTLGQTAPAFHVSQITEIKVEGEDDIERVARLFPQNLLFSTQPVQYWYGDTAKTIYQALLQEQE